MLISVVIPAYNVQNCIIHSVDTVLRQTFKDLEIIIIDDGSVDQTSSICDHLKKLDCRIRVVHQKNSGVSRARNAGIHLCRGNYVFFLDADDWLDLNFFCSVSPYLESNKYSMLCTPYFEVSQKNRYKKKCFYPSIKELTENEALTELFLYKMICWGPFACFYKRELVQELLFNENIRFGEDLLFKYQVIKQTKTPIMYAPITGYYYDTTRENSATNSYTISKRVDNVAVFKFLMSEEPNYKKILYYKVYLPRIIDFALAEDLCKISHEKDICIKFKNEIIGSLYKLLFSINVKIKLKIKLILLILPKQFRAFLLEIKHRN